MSFVFLQIFIKKVYLFGGGGGVVVVVVSSILIKYSLDRRGGLGIGIG